MRLIASLIRLIAFLIRLMLENGSPARCAAREWVSCLHVSDHDRQGGGACVPVLGTGSGRNPATARDGAREGGRAPRVIIRSAGEASAASHAEARRRSVRRSGRNPATARYGARIRSAGEVSAASFGLASSVGCRAFSKSFETAAQYGHMCHPAITAPSLRPVHRTDRQTDEMKRPLASTKVKPLLLHIISLPVELAHVCFGGGRFPQVARAHEMRHATGAVVDIFHHLPTHEPAGRSPSAEARFMHATWAARQVHGQQHPCSRVNLSLKADQAPLLVCNLRLQRRRGRRGKRRQSWLRYSWGEEGR